MKGTGVYSITNKVNGKRYVGSASISFRKRWKEHIRQMSGGIHHSKPLQRAWNKYGEDNFVFEVLATCPKEYCIKLEQWFIDNLKPEYNINPTAGSRLGAKVSEEERKRMSERGKARGADPEVRKRMSEMQLKRFQDPEQRAINKRIANERYAKESERIKNSERLKKHYSEPKNRERLKNQAINSWSNPSVVDKIKKGRKKWLESKENRIHVASHLIEYNKSAEGREKNRQSAIKRLSDPDVRKAMSESTSKLMADPEFYKKNREACAKGVRTESARKKNSETKKAQFKDEKFRQRMTELRYSFIYEIECPDGSVFTTKSMNSLISERGFDSYIIKKLNRGEAYKGYKLLSKTPIK